MTETILYPLKSKFPDPEHGDQLFFCGQCSPIEGLMAMFPDVRQNLDVRYADKADFVVGNSHVLYLRPLIHGCILVSKRAAPYLRLQHCHHCSASTDDKAEADE